MCKPKAPKAPPQEQQYFEDPPLLQLGGFGASEERRLVQGFRTGRESLLAENRVRLTERGLPTFGGPPAGPIGSTQLRINRGRNKKNNVKLNTITRITRNDGLGGKQVYLDRSVLNETPRFNLQPRRDGANTPIKIQPDQRSAIEKASAQKIPRGIKNLRRLFPSP